MYVRLNLIFPFCGFFVPVCKHGLGKFCTSYIQSNWGFCNLLKLKKTVNAFSLTVGIKHLGEVVLKILEV